MGNKPHALPTRRRPPTSDEPGRGHSRSEAVGVICITEKAKCSFDESALYKYFTYTLSSDWGKVNFVHVVLIPLVHVESHHHLLCP